MAATTLPLGLVPINVPVTLSRDGEFTATLTKNSGDWPVGTAVELWFVVDSNDLSHPIVWAADVAGPIISWNVTAVDCTTVIQGGAKNVRLHYNDLLWGKGKVTVV
jgi:hypothetical protein